MNQFALLTLAGPDRPGIVAEVSRALFETGCNIEDSSMTRMRNEFAVMLILRPPSGLSCQDLEGRLAEVAQRLDLMLHIRPMPAETPPTPAPQGEDCIITVLGADQPGIVYRVTHALADEGGNITDLTTQVIGSPTRPVYAMLIEAEAVPDSDHLKARMAALSQELGVEINVRTAPGYAY